MTLTEGASLALAAEGGSCWLRDLPASGASGEAPADQGRVQCPVQPLLTDDIPKPLSLAVSLHL